VEEIERKFLVADESWRDSVQVETPMRQGYLGGNSRSSVRVRVSGNNAWLNIKSLTVGVSREEFEYRIPVEDGQRMLDTLCDRPLIEKTRYQVPVGGHIWEVDVFDGANKGLVVAEVELGSPDEAFELPPWAGEEVSHDERYYNVSLATMPYRDW